MKSTNKYLVQQQAYYITANGDSLIPSIAIGAVNSYSEYFTMISQHEKKSAIFIKSGLIILGFLCLAGVALFGKIFNKAQRQVFHFYTKIRLWDVNELSYKCDQYLEKKGKTHKKLRKSSLLKIFPVNTFCDLIQPSYVHSQVRKITSTKHKMLNSE